MYQPGITTIKTDMLPTTTTAFLSGVEGQIGFYVYLLIDPRDDEVLYVVDGTGNRCFAHLADACATQADTLMSISSWHAPAKSCCRQSVGGDAEVPRA